MALSGIGRDRSAGPGLCGAPRPASPLEFGREMLRIPGPVGRLGEFGRRWVVSYHTPPERRVPSEVPLSGQIGLSFIPGGGDAASGSTARTT